MSWLDQFMNDKQREIAQQQARLKEEERLKILQAQEEQRLKRLQLQQRIARVKPMLHQKLAANQAKSLLSEVQKYWQGTAIWQAEKIADEVHESLALALGMCYNYSTGPHWNFRGDRSGYSHAVGKPFNKRFVSTVAIGIACRYDWDTGKDIYLAYATSFELEDTYVSDKGDGLKQRAKEVALGAYARDIFYNLEVEADTSNAVQTIQQFLKEDTWRRRQEGRLPGLRRPDQI
jgi:hypothetical protein